MRLNDAIMRRNFCMNWLTRMLLLAYHVTHNHFWLKERQIGWNNILSTHKHKEYLFIRRWWKSWSEWGRKNIYLFGGGKKYLFIRRRRSFYIKWSTAEKYFKHVSGKFLAITALLKILVLLSLQKVIRKLRQNVTIRMTWIGESKSRGFSAGADLCLI